MPLKWKKIPGYNGLYEISSNGEIKSHWLRIGQRPKILKQIIKITRTTPPYKQVSLVDNSGRKTEWLVHQLVLLTFRGAPKKGQESRHLNDIKYDNRLANLYYGTKSDNAKDRHRNGTPSQFCRPEVRAKAQYTKRRNKLLRTGLKRAK